MWRSLWSHLRPADGQLWSHLRLADGQLWSHLRPADGQLWSHLRLAEGQLWSHLCLADGQLWSHLRPADGQLWSHLRLADECLATARTQLPPYQVPIRRNVSSYRSEHNSRRYCSTAAASQSWRTPTLHTLLRCSLAVSKSMAAKSVITGLCRQSAI